eukprot:5393357-Pyramimonas_sp.AAC.1
MHIPAHTSPVRTHNLPCPASHPLSRAMLHNVGANASFLVCVNVFPAYDSHYRYSFQIHSGTHFPYVGRHKVAASFGWRLLSTTPSLSNLSQLSEFTRANDQVCKCTKAGFSGARISSIA